MEKKMTMNDCSTMVNGVDVKKMGETIDTIKSKPEMADFHFRVTNKWMRGGHNQFTIKEFSQAGRMDTIRTKEFIMDSDEPPALLGKDIGPNPVEYVLGALSGCMTTSLAYHAAAEGYKIESIESEHEGDIDLHGFLGLKDNVRKGYKNIKVTFKVKGDIPQDKVRELVMRSPVLDVITNPVPVTIDTQMMK